MRSHSSLSGLEGHPNWSMASDSKSTQPGRSPAKIKYNIYADVKTHATYYIYEGKRVK